jgi:hypothetical protein
MSWTALHRALLRQHFSGLRTIEASIEGPTGKSDYQLIGFDECPLWVESGH